MKTKLKRDKLLMEIQEFIYLKHDKKTYFKCIIEVKIEELISELKLLENENS